TAPSLLFGLFAGSLADIIDRRKLIFATQVMLLAASALLGFATLLGWIGPGTLLALTFLIGAGFTFYMPAQQASINEFVGRNDLSRAVALGAVAFNVARAVGAALAQARAGAAGRPRDGAVRRAERTPVRAPFGRDACADRDQSQLRRVRERVLGAAA